MNWKQDRRAKTVASLSDGSIPQQEKHTGAASQSVSRSERKKNPGSGNGEGKQGQAQPGM